MNEIEGEPGFYSFPCESTLEISVEFAGVSAPIRASDMNLGLVKPGSNLCVAGIMGSSLSLNIFGLTFLKKCVKSPLPFASSGVDFFTQRVLDLRRLRGRKSRLCDAFLLDLEHE